MKTYLRILLFIILLQLVGCKNDVYTFDEVKINFDKSLFKSDGFGTIEGNKEFVENILKGYLEELDKYDTVLYKEFKLSGNVSAKIVFSSFDGSLIYIYKSNKSILSFSQTNLPIQLALFNGVIDLENPDQIIKDPFHFIESIEEAKRYYFGNHAQIYLTNEGNKIKNGGSFAGFWGPVVLENPFRILSFEKNTSAIFFGNIHARWTDTLALKSAGLPYKNVDLYLNGPLVVTGEKNFEWGAKVAREIGESYFLKERVEIITKKSEFFKKALANPELSKYAKEIVDKKRKYFDSGEYYKLPIYEFDKDLSELRKKSLKYNITDSSYIDKLISQAEANPRYSFLWEYSDINDFVYQYMIIEFLIFVLIVIIYRVKIIGKSLVNYILIPHKAYAFLGFIIAINGFLITYKPEHLNLLALWKPFIIFLGVIIYLLYKLYKEGAKDVNHSDSSA
jgi:hypothetical protein